MNRLALSTYAASLVMAGCTAAPALAYLRIHPANPHYFQETTTGQPVLIAAYTSIVPGDAGFDYVNQIRADIQAHRIGYSRVWHFTPWSMSNAIWPWAASGTPGGYWGGLGGNRLDMNVFNNTYWNRMADAMSRASSAGIYAQIMLFDRVGMSPGTNERWGNNPWAANNNINGLEVPTANPPNDGTPEFYQYATRPNLRNQQERYVRKMIDVTIPYSHVIYEIENEHWDSTDTAWANYYGQFVKNYIAANYPASPRLVSYNSLVGDLENLYTSPAIDIINKHYGNEAETNPDILNSYLEPRWSFNKPINVDEFANGVTDPALLRRQCWTIITSGGHFHIEDAGLAAQPYEICENIRSFLAVSGWNFIGAAPNKNLITAGGGFCMAQPGVEYVCYFPSGGSKTVNLAAATYRAQWWNPRNGGFYNAATISHAGGGRSFSTPDASDWVLMVTNRPAPVTILDARPAAALAIDGNPADWNLPQFTTTITAGSAGAGDIAVIGFGGFENWTCFTGGHWTGGQFPPAGPADHAARIYARHDADYVYFLARVDDSDRRTPNGVASNWANDCIEFYIDPANDGGATPLSNSTSDVQLVIDAADQKNVYAATAGYAAQVLAGVTSAVTTDAAGWWLEIRLAKNALSPAIPGAAGTIGIDFVLRDNDANNNSLTSLHSWRDPEVSEAFPTKIPDRWGKLRFGAAGSVPADFDADGDVDLADFAFLQACFTPPVTQVGPECAAADLTGDTVVGPEDFAVFLPCLAGANRSPGC